MGMQVFLVNGKHKLQHLFIKPMHQVIVCLYSHTLHDGNNMLIYENGRPHPSKNLKLST